MGISLSHWFEEELLPAIFENLPSVFPEFGWKRDGSEGWKASHESFTHENLGCRADRVVCRRAFGFLIHGGESQNWLAYLNGGQMPLGETWLRIVRDLARRVGMNLPNKELSPEIQKRIEAKRQHQNVLEQLSLYCQHLLLEAPEAEEARKTIEDRGFKPIRCEIWDLGFMPEDTPPLVSWAESQGWSWEETRETLVASGLLVRDEDSGQYRVHLRNRIIAPWRGPDGSILSWWGRKLPSAHERAPKYSYAKGQERSCPYLFDRIRRDERILLVEGVLDALQAREHGFNAVATGGTSIDSFLPLLKRTASPGLMLAMDPDDAGLDAMRRISRKLLTAGISTFLIQLPQSENQEKLDPDAFLRTFGPDAFSQLLQNAPHALRWIARDLMHRHGALGWTDPATESAIREAIQLASEIPAQLQPMITPLFWGELSLELPISADSLGEVSRMLQEERAWERREREARSRTQDIIRLTEKHLAEDRPLEAQKALLDAADEIRTEESKKPRVLARVALDELDTHEAYLQGLRGRNRMGMSQQSLPGLDEALLGLRGLLLLAGPPGTGKTSLAVQLGLGALEEETETAMVLLSLEQTRFEHLTRIRAHLSEVDWETVAMGSPECRNGRDRQAETYFTRKDYERLQEGQARLKAIGSRLLILDDENFPAPSAEKLLQAVETLKTKTHASKVLIIVDYLQLWPVQLEEARALRTDLDRDKWQIGQLKALRNRLGAEDAVMVISEAKKDDWEGSLGLGSVMGSARGTYTPDAVLVLQPVSDNELAGKKAPVMRGSSIPVEPDGGARKREELAAKGISLLRLRIVKGRDGVHRGSFELAFRFRQTRFEEIEFSDFVDGR